MKAYLKAFGVGLIVMGFVFICFIALHFAIYNFVNEEFENFFGIKVEAFNWLKYLIGWLIGGCIYAFIIRSDFEE